MRRKSAVIVVLVAFLAAACGSRVGEQQAIDEARQDALRGGLASQRGPAAGGPGVDGDVGVGDLGEEGETGSSGDVGSIAGPGGSGEAAAGGGGQPGARSASQTGGGPATTLPPGGNGGATDVGVNANEILLGNVSTLSGPVPGLFRGALVGTQAFAAYQNSQGGLYGRQLRVVSGDDSLDSGKNRAAHLQLKDKVFAFVGSFSTNDDGGVSVMRECNCPDVGGSLSRSRFHLPNHFTPQPQPRGWRTGGFQYYKRNFPEDVIKHVAMFTSAIEAARQIADDERWVMESLGYRVVYSREVASGETNFTGDVIQMRNAGVKMIVWQGDVGGMSRLAAAMHQQNFKVTLPNWGNAMYDQNAFRIAGAEALEGSLLDQVYAMFQGEDAGRVPEVALFNQWMKRVAPNQTVDLFALYGWISARLFTDAAVKVGPELTRPKLLAELGKIGTWDARGLVAPVNVGQKKASDCLFIFKITGGKFVRVHPTDDRTYDCSLGPFVYRS